MTKHDETTISEDDVRAEHLQSARAGPHWAYLFGVLGSSLVLMLALIAWLGS